MLYKVFSMDELQYSAIKYAEVIMMKMQKWELCSRSKH